jgi:hypothetical protein
MKKVFAIFALIFIFASCTKSELYEFRPTKAKAVFFRIESQDFDSKVLYSDIEVVKISE